MISPSISSPPRNEGPRWGQKSLMHFGSKDLSRNKASCSLNKEKYTISSALKAWVVLTAYHPNKEPVSFSDSDKEAPDALTPSPKDKSKNPDSMLPWYHESARSRCLASLSGQLKWISKKWRQVEKRACNHFWIAISKIIYVHDSQKPQAIQKSKSRKSFSTRSSKHVRDCNEQNEPDKDSQASSFDYDIKTAILNVMSMAKQAINKHGTMEKVDNQ